MNDKDKLMMEMFKAVENTKKMRDSMDKSFEKFKEKRHQKEKRLFTINCKVKDLKKELERIQPEIIKKYPKLIISDKNRKVEGF